MLKKHKRQRVKKTSYDALRVKQNFIEASTEQIGDNTFDIATCIAFMFISHRRIERSLGTLISACQSYKVAKYNRNRNSSKFGSQFTRILVQILSDSRGYTYRELVTKINEQFKRERLEQRAGLYCSKQQSEKLFLN
jgi:hypothetical protein